MSTVNQLQARSEANQLRANTIKIGQWIERLPWAGRVESIRELGTAVGDGSVSWPVFQLREFTYFGDLPPFTNACGSLSADELIQVSSEEGCRLSPGLQEAA